MILVSLVVFSILMTIITAGAAVAIQEAGRYMVDQYEQNGRSKTNIMDESNIR